MKTFNDYVSLKEIAAYGVGTDLLGRSTLDDKSQAAITAALQAFEIILSQDSSGAAQFLNRHSAIPEIQQIMRNHNLDSFKDSDFKRDAKRAAMKGKRFISGGVDLGKNDTDDVVTTPDADANSSPLM